MRLIRRRFLELVASAVALPATAWAQTYPSQPMASGTVGAGSAAHLVGLSLARPIISAAGIKASN